MAATNKKSGAKRRKSSASVGIVPSHQYRTKPGVRRAQRKTGSNIGALKPNGRPPTPLHNKISPAHRCHRGANRFEACLRSVSTLAENGGDRLQVREQTIASDEFAEVAHDERRPTIRRTHSRNSIHTQPVTPPAAFPGNSPNVIHSPTGRRATNVHRIRVWKAKTTIPNPLQKATWEKRRHGLHNNPRPTAQHVAARGTECFSTTSNSSPRTKTPDAPKTLGNYSQVPIRAHRTRLICHLLPN